MAQGTYRQFCPVAMAAELLCTRWTIVLLRELIAGSTRFNDLRRGVPRMSPALLSQRLKDLQAAGVVARVTGASGAVEYRLTEAGKELQPIVDAFGIWGQRRIKAEVSLEHLDVQLLMWDMHRGLNTTPMPQRRVVIQFIYPDLPANQRNAWLLVDPDIGVDLCAADPGFDVDLYVSVDLRTMTAIWMGYETVRGALSDQRMTLTGDDGLAKDMQTWLGLSPFAPYAPGFSASSAAA
ncbi:DNA-binding HxlR family transcriptional regulator [Brevundimonas alba]|uniref:DNA-binding HxlR family transcriptional regulator n=1 Tax=Brevundimonas alba TaxID=74314 RepID=A0A7X6BNG7_9CAUL|nr:helix-turn-helix domain-containing protein [Brevundimonas alba]NJC41392.1 DNA-binding HxlR family transcriptional regulator [Brevundimonas alba]